MFFQNVFDSEFVGSMIYSDRQYNLTFRIPANKNRTDLMICWNEGPFNLSGNNVLTINFSLDNVYYSPISVTLTNSSSVTAETIVNTLNADATFSAWFTASTYNDYKQVAIKSIKPKVAIKVYISNSSAETIMRFNKRASVRELPSYYLRHTISNAANYTDSVGMLIRLDESNSVDQAIITAAGFTPSAMKADWQLLASKSESFLFEKRVYDGQNRLSYILTFPAGAAEGNLAKKTVYKYIGYNSTTIDRILEIPYVLTSSDVATIVP